MAQVASYVIAGTPRTGSTLLCRLLAGTGAAGCPASFLRRESIAEHAADWGIPLPSGPDEAGFDRAYLAAMRREGSGDTGIFGLRLMWGSVADAARRLGGVSPADFPSRFEAAFGPTLYIHLSRLNKLAQAISLVRAEQSGLWHRAPDGSVIEGVEEPCAVTFDGARIAAREKELVAHDAAWTNFFRSAGIEPRRLTYEALTADPRRALAGILTALGRDPHIAETAIVGTARMADRISLLWAERLRREPARRPTLGFPRETGHDAADLERTTPDARRTPLRPP